jgi:hypothetical protein
MVLPASRSDPRRSDRHAKVQWIASSCLNTASRLPRGTRRMDTFPLIRDRFEAATRGCVSTDRMALEEAEQQAELELDARSSASRAWRIPRVNRDPGGNAGNRL